MAADGTMLPVIVVQKSSAPSNQPVNKASNRLESLAADSSHAWVPRVNCSHPRPGDVYRRKRGAGGPRPLGLLPDRSRANAWNELTMLLTSFPHPSSAVTATQPPSPPLPVSSMSQPDATSLEENAARLTVTVARRAQQDATAEEKYSGSNMFSSKAGAYRLPTMKQEQLRAQFHVDAGAKADDREYLDTLAKCTMNKYYGTHENSGPRHPPPAGEVKVRLTGLSPQQAAVLKRLSPSAKLRR